jgi:Lar family restriction alleviation protein
MADPMQQALLPCPFCGEAAKHTVWGDAGFNKVECTYCDVGMDYFYHQDDAFEAWNRRAALRAAPEARPLIARALSEWHEDDGNVMWWAWCGHDWAGEPAWCGTPNDSDWPGYHTHWTPHPAPPVAARPQGVKDV